MPYLGKFFIILLIVKSFCSQNVSEEWAIEFTEKSIEVAKSFANKMGLVLENRLSPWNIYIFSRFVQRNDSLGNTRVNNYEENILVLLEKECTELGLIPSNPVNVERVRSEKQRSKVSTRGVSLMQKYNISWIKKQTPMDIVLKSNKLQLDSPGFVKQWYLNGEGLQGINALPVWNKNISGNGVNIAIVDSCVFYEHHDLRRNYVDNGYVFRISENCRHGTAVAGIISSVRDAKHCGVGVAFESKFSSSPIIFDSNIASDYISARALLWRYCHTDIYSNSWGPPDIGYVFSAPGHIVKQAIDYGIANGRNGKGSIYVWAAGNGNSVGDSCSYDGFASNRKVICVGASDYYGRHSEYSEGCASLLVVAPSSTMEPCDHKCWIFSTGPTQDSCVNDFGGTSASCPIVSGVIALMLEANPRLNWLEVQDILVRTSRKPNNTYYEWVMNGAGLEFNYYFGFGIVNANEAVNMAEKYNARNAAPDEVMYRSILNTDINIRYPLSISFNVKRDLIIHHAEVSFRLLGISSIRCSMSLESPLGTRTLLQGHDQRRRGSIEWVHTVKSIWGENAKGVWKLHISPLRRVFITDLQFSVYGAKNKWVRKDISVKNKYHVRQGESHTAGYFPSRIVFALQLLLITFL